MKGETPQTDNCKARHGNTTRFGINGVNFTCFNIALILTRIRFASILTVPASPELGES